MISKLLQFYRHGGVDQNNQTLEFILSQEDEWLENNHEYIQWLFPLKEPSSANPFAPILNDKEIKAFCLDATIQIHLNNAFERMLQFYGFIQKKSAGKVECCQTDFFKARSHVWLQPGNHNLWRMTRILKSLSILGKNKEADAFFDCLVRVYREYPDTIGKTTFGIWSDAARHQ